MKILESAEKIVELANGKYKWLVYAFSPIIFLCLPFLHIYSTIKGYIQGPSEDYRDQGQDD